MRHWIVIVLLLVPSSAFAWDGKGHRIIAAVAERRLKEAAPDALKKALDLLGEPHLANVAMVAEDWGKRFGTTPTSAWHFVNIPIKASDYKPERDCQFPGCLVDAVDLFRRRLGNPAIDRVQQKEALIYLIHLVGDIHQGWHCGAGELSDGSSDENGRRIRVTYKGGHVPGNRTRDPKNDNLHFFWDVSLLEIEGLSDKAMVEHLFKDTLGERNPDELVTPETMRMVNETHTIAQDSIVRDGTDLDEEYVYRHFNLDAMDYALLRAGLTLAHIIKHAFPP
jgi:nuclease S1